MYLQLELQAPEAGWSKPGAKQGVAHEALGKCLPLGSFIQQTLTVPETEGQLGKGNYELRSRREENVAMQGAQEGLP